MKVNTALCFSSRRQKYTGSDALYGLIRMVAGRDGDVQVDKEDGPNDDSDLEAVFVCAADVRKSGEGASDFGMADSVVPMVGPSVERDPRPRDGTHKYLQV